MQYIKFLFKIFSIVLLLIHSNSTKASDPTILNKEKTHFQYPSEQESNKISFEVQAAIELIGWHYSLGLNIENEHLIKGISAVIKDCITGKIEFPEAEFENLEDIDKSLGIIFADCVRSEFKWEWIKVQYENKDFGWCVISPDKKYLIHTNQVFEKHLKGLKITFNHDALFEKIRSGKLPNSENIMVLN